VQQSHTFHKNIHSLKKSLPLVLSLFLLIALNCEAANRYWVGGTGLWSSSAHWSLKSGGKGGASVPTSEDNIFIDTHSFSNATQTIKIQGEAVCADFNWTATAVFDGSSETELSVYGSLILPSLMTNHFKGKINLLSSSPENKISTSGKILLGDLIINGTGSWTLKDNLHVTASVYLVKGSLHTNGKAVSCGSFISKGEGIKVLDISNSVITVENDWNLSETKNIYLESSNSELQLKKGTSRNFKPGNHNYNKITRLDKAAFTLNIQIIQLAENKCNGDCKAVLSATVQNGMPPYTYRWGSLATHVSSNPIDTLGGLCQQTITVLVEDANGDNGNASKSILAPSALIVSIPGSSTGGTNNVSCFGLCDATLKPIVAGGTAPYTYSWTPGGIVPPPGTISNLCAQATPYKVTVTDFNACTGSATKVVTEPAVLVANGSSTNINCFGVCDGTATTAPSGGTTPYTHSWSNGQHTASISSLCIGSYTDTIRDKNGCKALYTATVTQPAVLTLALSKNNASCGGVCDGKATATLTGGTAPYKYVWSTGSTTTSASLTNTIIALCAGNYTVTVTDKNNCVKTANITVTEPAVLDANATATNVTCFGACNGSATVVVTGGSGGNVYLWTPGNPTGSTTNTITNLCPNTYTITVHDVNNCTATDIVTVTEPAVLKSTPTSTNISCFGACNGTATASATGGTTPYTYRWLPIIPPVTTTTISSLCPGTYSLVVTDVNSCKDTSAGFTITQPPLLVVNATKSNITCNGLCNGSASANPSGGTAPYTYSWSSGQTTKGISSLCVGNYTVTVTDANGCVKTQIVSITQPNVLTVSLSSTAISCNGDCNATVTSTVGGGTPGYIFSWAPGGETTANISNKCAGTYTLTVTDNAGCIKTATQNIFQPTPLSLSTGSSNISCFGQCNGSALANIGGGTQPSTFSWAPGNQTTPSISNLCAGSYTVTAKDSKGCTQAKTITITQPAQIFANPFVVSNASCAGLCNGSASSTPIGGTPPYTYLWTPGNTTAATAGNLCQGTYSVKVTDANSCTSTQSITITQPVPVSATITGSTSSCNICNGTATANAVGGTGPYTYSWAPTGQTTVTATGLCPNTTYTVTVTDSKGCTSTATVTIIQTIIIQITTSSTVLSCAGNCDGIVTANAVGGTVPYSFLWAGPGGPYSTQTVTGLCVGAYTVTVSDAAGCFNTDTVTFTNPPVLSVNTSATNLTCNGVCNGTATGIATGGTGAYTYSWMPGGQTTQTATGLCVGSYTLTVKDVKGCTATSTVTITQPTAVVDHVTSTAANCTKSDGTITVAPTGGVPPYTYDWGPGSPTGDGTVKVINLFAGVYTLAIRDNSGCVSNFSYLLNNIAGPNTAMTHANVSCHDACDGSASVVASGGAGGYTYLWNPGGSVATSISALCGTTTYTVQVQDASACITIDTATIINPPLLLLNQVVSNESCGGACDGSIALSPSGGKAPYTYLWSSGQTTASISSLCAGNYSVTVKDANNCSTNLTIAVVSPPKLTVTLASTNVRCKGACNGTATATTSGGTPGYTYSWTNQPASVVLPAIINLCPNQYIVTVTDAKGCKAKDTVDITEPTALTSSTIKKDLSCNGVCNGLAVVIASGGTAPYLYAWNPGPVSNDTASSLCAGTYNAAVIDANGCFSFPPAVTISEPSIIIPQASATNPLCNGSCNGTAVANPTGGKGTYTYSWLPGGFTTKNIANLCAGTYTVNVRDSAGCSISQNVTLVNPSILTANTTSISPLCVGSCNGSATSNPVGGTPGYTYSWSPVASTSSSISSLCAGNYTVVVTDANNCKDTQSVVVTNPLPVNAVISSTPSSCGACDGTIAVNPISGTPGFTYLWSGGLPSKSTQTNVCAGIYTVLVTDTLGCDSTFSVAISNSSGPTGETVSTTAVKCYSQCNGSGKVIPIGGTPPYSYLWNNTPIASTTNTAINLCAGNYLVQVTDSSSCVHFSPVTITQPSQILSNATITSAACSGVCTGKIVVAPTGGTGTNAYTYLWTPGGQTTATVNSMCPGTYSITITDSSLCTKTDSFVVGQSSPLAANVTAVNINCAAQCNGSAFIKITTGTPPYSIQWNDALAQTTDTAKGLCAGNYAVDVKDALGCSIKLNVTVKENAAIVAVPVVTDATCGACDGQAVLTTSGGSAPYIYSWSNGQTSATATNLCSGLYTVNIKDNLGCEKNISIPINNTNGPTGATIISTNVTCNALCNGAVTAITPVGGIPPYQYLWIQSGLTTPTLTSLCAGTYYVRITDSAGCSLVDSVTITSPPALLANQTIKTASCSVCDGEITIAPSGGVPPYSVSWNTGATSTKITNLCAGIYTATISDANCSQTVVIPLNTQNGPTVTATSTDIACNDSCNGTAIAIATGGLTPYTVSWSNGATNLSLSNLCAGTYLAQVKGADGCASSASVTIVQQPSVFVNLGIVNDPLCNGSANGTITVVPNGGTLPYTYSWTPAAGTTATITSLTANTYTVIVIDANGCKASRSATLIDPPALTISHTVTNSSCNTTPDGAIDVTTGGGTTPYVFQWSGGSTAKTEDLTNVLSGSYTITVTDLHGCRIMDSAVIAPNQFITADAGKDTTFCQASSYTLSATKSVNAVSYKWFQLPANTLVGTAVTIVVNPPTGTTQYYVIADNGTGCTATDTVALISNLLPGANAGPDKNVYIGNSATIGGNPTTTSVGSSIVWAPPVFLDNPLVSNPVCTPTATTIYTVKITGLNGCISIDSVLVTLLPTIDIPSGITPNGDGANDVWQLSGIEAFPDCTVELYNRWGELIFQSPGYKVKWDGTYKGKILPVGTYYYIIDLHDPSIPVYTGSLTIMR
jgi:gliding motility-associated-like protein